MGRKIKYKLKSALVLLGLVIVFIGYFAYQKTASDTKIAFINFVDFQTANILRVEKDYPVQITKIDKKDILNKSLSGFDVVFIRMHGIKISDKEKNTILALIKKGVMVHSVQTTDPDNDLTNLSPKDQKNINLYLQYGGAKNMKNLLAYTRTVLDAKLFFNPKYDPPKKLPLYGFFHLGEDKLFKNYNNYQKYYEKKGFYKEGQPRVAIVTANVGPQNMYTRAQYDAIIKNLEKTNINCYPIFGFAKRLENIKAVKPDLIVFTPHGGLAPGKRQQTIKLLKTLNVPVLVPVNVFQLYKKWLLSQKGMSGGMNAQSILNPELEGGIEPYAISAYFLNEDNLKVFKPIPKRIKVFCNRIRRWLTLRKKKNSDKRIAIYYYKGPGRNALVAGGLEVADSLLNLLKHLKASGYKVGALPSSGKELYQLINKKAPVLGPYATKTFQKFLKTGDPALVNVKDYLKWVHESIVYKRDPAFSRSEWKKINKNMYDRVIDEYGFAPGKYMKVVKNNQKYIAVARIRFGNVVILPQPLSAYGQETAKIVHGVEEPPPHPYIASYLWVRKGFKADALVHFGTHGSFEFLPWKQPALSHYDWPDALLGDLPHIYPYVINNIGEAIIAKRRSYAVIISHLTPPFMESSLYGELSKLHDKLHIYLQSESPAMRKILSKTIKTMVIKLKINTALDLKDFQTKVLDKDTFDKIHNHIHEIEETKVKHGLYTLGDSYTKEELYKTTFLMALDRVSDALSNMDVIKGKIKESQLNNKHFVEKNYKSKAAAMIDAILKRGKTPLSFVSVLDQKRADKYIKENPTQNKSFDKMMGVMISMMEEGGKADQKKVQKSFSEKSFLNKSFLEDYLFELFKDKKQENFIVSLKNQTQYERLSSVLKDPSKMKKAQMMAKMIPKMREALNILQRQKIESLVKAMLNKEVYNGVFKIIESPQFKDKMNHYFKANLKEELSLLALKPLNYDFLKSLKSEKTWVKTFNLLKNKRVLQKAFLLSKHIPKIRKALAPLKNPKMRVFLSSISNKRNLFLKTLESDDFKKLIHKKQLLVFQKNKVKALNTQNIAFLFSLLRKGDFKNLIQKSSIANLKKSISLLDFYEEFKYYIQFSKKDESPNFKALKAFLNSKSFSKIIVDAKKILLDKIAIKLLKEKEFYLAVKLLRDSLLRVKTYYNDLKNSPKIEMQQITRALNGEYISPGSGGDALHNPNAVPTGKNLYAINPERVPSKEAWQLGVILAKKLLKTVIKKKGAYPKKVAFTFWGGEFVRSQGVQLAQLFYLLGVKPVWNRFDEVKDVKLIPLKELKRPRIEVVVQTSGQFRDIAASRIFLINKAVKLASEDKESSPYKNYVKEGVLLSEKMLKEKGVTPKAAKELAHIRVFGGRNGAFGSEIDGLVEAGDRWNKEEQIQNKYLFNMGAIYSQNHWGEFHEGAFEAALKNAEVVLQPRSSNTTGPLSLDHVYEFMGGLNSAIRKVNNGKDPLAFFNDLRNPRRAKVQGVKEAIWVEAQSTIFNPKYIKGMQNEGATAAESFAETFRNMYGWNVMKPKAIDKALWDKAYQVFIKDEYKLNMRSYFKNKNPYALQEMTAVMLETIRKGYWKASKDVIKTLSKMHVELIKNHEAGCSGFVCNNEKLREMILNNISDDLKKSYVKAIQKVREFNYSKKGMMRLKKEVSLLKSALRVIQRNQIMVYSLLALLILIFASLYFGAYKKKKKDLKENSDDSFFDDFMNNKEK